MKSLITLMRPWQWIKNGFVFAPLFFSGHIADISLLGYAVVAFICFSLACSGIYCFNDICDVESDRIHPVKKTRPIASGKVSIRNAYIISILSIATSYIIVCTLPGDARTGLCSVLTVYVVLNIAYCLWLKYRALIDIFIISTGFVLRLIAGASVTMITLSHWIVIMTFLLALFLSLAKRRDDVVIMENTGLTTRKNIVGYNLVFMNQAISIVAAMTMVAYLLYTVSPDVTARIGSDNLYYTSVFVLLGILRYLQLTIVDVRSGSPTKVLLTDRYTQLCVAAWGITFAVIIYLP